jgi:hypothetical protein
MLEVGTKGIYIMMINVPRRRQNGLQKEPSQGKEIVPPSLGQKLAKKQNIANRCNPLITKGKPISETFEKAMDEIKNGTISLRKVDRH